MQRHLRVHRRLRARPPRTRSGWARGAPARLRPRRGVSDGAMPRATRHVCIVWTMQTLERRPLLPQAAGAKENVEFEFQEALIGGAAIDAT